MRILLSNDDGVHAPGIQTLAKALREFADVQVVAPDRNRSGASNSLTLESSLRTFTFENGDIAVQMGTPTDCVYLGVNALMRPRPDIVVSGIIAAVWRNRWPDRLSMTIAVSGISFPAFALGMLLIQVFSVELGWLPTVGADSWQHYILPSLTLGAAVAAVMARFTRASFVDVLSEDYMRTARAKGVSETWVVLKHGLRNAMIPVVTMMGLQSGFLLGGSIVVEKVFNWPGLGRLLVDSVEMRDYPVIQAEILLFSLEFILINLVVDVLYAAINPAIRYK